MKSTDTQRHMSVSENRGRDLPRWMFPEQEKSKPAATLKTTDDVPATDDR